MHRPPTWRHVAEATPATNGVSSCTLLRPAGRHADGSSSLFESGQRTPSTLGPSRERTLMAGRSSAGRTGYIAAIDEKAWRGHVGSARASRVPHSVSRHCPRETAQSRVREAQGRVILLERGWIAAQLRPPGTGCSPANGTPEELRRLARPCVLSIALPLRSTMIYRNVRQKSLGCLRIERNTNILGRPQLVE